MSPACVGASSEISLETTSNSCATITASRPWRNKCWIEQCKKYIQNRGSVMIKTPFWNHSCNEPHLRIVTTKHSTLTTLFSPRTSHILNKKEAFFSVFVFSLRKQRLGGREMLLCQHLQDFIHAIFHCCPRKLPLVFLYLDRKAKIFFYYLTVYPSPLS